jgi:transcriptional regulator with XRE-family HTH domain
MNAVLAKNIRTFREAKHWTQQHLADTSGIVLRTVQRAEKGEGASVESLGALANAFDVTIDLLQTDFVALLEQAQGAHEAMKKTHDFVPMQPITCSTGLAVIDGAEASVMQCASTNDAAQDTFAAFKSSVMDMVDVWDAVDPINHREWMKSAFAQVEEMNRLGLVVCVGKAKRVIRTGKGPVEFGTLYVIAWPKGEEKALIAVEKSA